jgi:hypothetical protein
MEEQTEERTEGIETAASRRGSWSPSAQWGPGWYAVDPGDTHDKGEESLCTGEAA